jgi:transcriptional regulator with XRE-family HTH domain
VAGIRLTQAQLARAMGVSPGRVSQIEREPVASKGMAVMADLGRGGGMSRGQGAGPGAGSNRAK